MPLRCSVASDLHLEFHDIALPGGDILLLAGDCFLAAPMREWRVDKQNRVLRDRMERFAQQELRKYTKVYYVMGNHDHYGEIIEQTPVILTEFFAEHAPHVTLLNNSSEIYEGVAFIGSTLWATYGHGKHTAVQIMRQLTDFYRIKTKQPYQDGSPAAHSAGRPITVPDIMREHRKAQRYLKKVLTFTRENRIPSIVITHHAPSYLSKSKRFKYVDDGVDDAYYSNQHRLIEQNPQIAVWIYGHTHDNCHYQIGKTKILSNQRGYFPDEEGSRHFDVTAEDFDLEEIKRQPGEPIPARDHDQAGGARFGGDDQCAQERSAVTKPTGICGAELRKKDKSFIMILTIPGIMGRKWRA